MLVYLPRFVSVLVCFSTCLFYCWFASVLVCFTAGLFQCWLISVLACFSDGLFQYYFISVMICFSTSIGVVQFFLSYWHLLHVIAYHFVCLFWCWCGEALVNKHACLPMCLFLYPWLVCWCAYLSNFLLLTIAVFYPHFFF